MYSIQWMCCVKLLEIIELMLHSCHGLVCAGLLELGLSLSHTRAQGSVCVSFEPWPLTALPCAVLWELDQSSVQLWEACGREEAVVWWVSASWIVPFRWPLALFSSLTHLDPCGPVRWVCVWGGGKLAFLRFWSICSAVALFIAVSATVKRGSEW